MCAHTLILLDTQLLLNSPTLHASHHPVPHTCLLTSLPILQGGLKCKKRHNMPQLTVCLRAECKMGQGLQTQQDRRMFGGATLKIVQLLDIESIAIYIYIYLPIYHLSNVIYLFCTRQDGAEVPVWVHFPPGYILLCR